MARVENQVIPSAMLDAWGRSLAPTKYLGTSYGKDYTHRDVCAKKFDPDPDEAEHASRAQQDQRELFQEACAGWSEVTDQEKAAYYQLSIMENWWYFNFFMSRALLAFGLGKHWDDIARPNALRYNIGTGEGDGFVTLTYTTELGDPWTRITWDIEMFPAVYKDWGYPGPHEPAYVRILNAPVPPEDWPPAQENYYIFHPQEPTRYTNEYWQDIEPPRYIEITFFRSATEPEPCVLWLFELGDVEEPDEIYNFLPALD